MARISGTSSSAATKCISDVPGLVKQVRTPASTSVRSRAWAPVGTSALPHRGAGVVERGAVHAGDRGLPGEAQRRVQVGLHDPEHVAHAGLAARGHRPRPGAPDEDGPRAERDYLEDVEPRAHAAVDEDLDLVADGVD